MASHIYSLHCIAESVAVEKFGRLDSSQPIHQSCYLSAIFILSDLLCKVANPAMFFLPKCFWAQQSTKVVYRQCLYYTVVKPLSLNVGFTQRPPVTKPRNLLMSFRSNTWIDFTQDSCICKN